MLHKSVTRLVNESGPFVKGASRCYNPINNNYKPTKITKCTPKDTRLFEPEISKSYAEKVLARRDPSKDTQGSVVKSDRLNNIFGKKGSSRDALAKQLNCEPFSMRIPRPKNRKHGFLMV